MTACLFASLLQLDRRAIKALKITDTYSLHRVIYSLFDDLRSEEEKNTHQPSGFLWTDKGGNALGKQILMLSDREPALNINGKYGDVHTKKIPENFLDYFDYRFSITVNPTRREAASRKLQPIKGRDAIAQWFIERAPINWGFSVQPRYLQVNQVRVLRFNDKNQRIITLQQADLSGYLTVTDAEVFKKSFARGIGRSRSFGCGLLQIVPLIDNSLPEKE